MAGMQDFGGGPLSSPWKRKNWVAHVSYKLGCVLGAWFHFFWIWGYFHVTSWVTYQEGLREAYLGPKTNALTRCFSDG